jgi:hypothetical protein
MLPTVCGAPRLLALEEFECPFSIEADKESLNLSSWVTMEYKCSYKYLLFIFL